MIQVNLLICIYDIYRYHTGEQLGNHHKKRLRDHFHYFLVIENGQFTSMIIRRGKHKGNQYQHHPK